MKKIEFDNNTLTKKANEIYTNSSFVFYQDANGVYYVTPNGGDSEGDEVGTIQDVIEYLELFA